MKHGEEIVGVTTIAVEHRYTPIWFGLAYLPDGDYEVRGFPWSVTLPATATSPPVGAALLLRLALRHQRARLSHLQPG